MTQARPQHETLETSDHRHLLCWKSTFAGLVIAFMGFMMLTALGAGVLGFSAEALISREEGSSALASGAGLYLGLSAVVALFCGSYFALRLSNFKTAKVGAGHGILIASLFFFILLSGITSGLGSVASGLGQLAKGAGSQVPSVASNPLVQDAVDKVLGNYTLKSDPRDVAQGLYLRLVQGNVDSATAYLAHQTGQSPEVMKAKVVEAKAEFDDTVKRAGEKTAHGLADASLCLVVVLLAGLIGATVGGRVGAHSNADRPLAVLNNQRGSVLPYVAGWILGVPVSLLCLVAVLRTIF